MNTPKSVISSKYLTPCRTIGLKRKSSTPKTPINLKQHCTDENSPHLTSLEEKRLARVEERGKSWDDRGVKNLGTPLSTRPNCENRTGSRGVSEGCERITATTTPDLLRLSPSSKAVRGRSVIRNHATVNLSPCDGESIAAYNEEKGVKEQSKHSRRSNPSFLCPDTIESIDQKGTLRNGTHAAINLSPCDDESIAANNEKKGLRKQSKHSRRSNPSLLCPDTIESIKEKGTLRNGTHAAINLSPCDDESIAAKNEEKRGGVPSLEQLSPHRSSKGVRELSRDSRRSTPSLPCPRAIESIEEKGTVRTDTHAVITPCSVRLVRLKPNSNSWKVHTPPPPHVSSPQQPFTGFASLDDIRSTVDTLNLKLDRLNQLQQSNIYCKTHNILSLRKSTDKWKEACKDVVLKIQEDLKRKGHEVTISTILKEHNIPFEMLDFNQEFDEFN